MADRCRSQQLRTDDLWGKALLDYHEGISNSPLVLHTSFGPPETVPLDIFFRDKAQLSDLEVFALELCDGPVIDVGAGSGCHSLILQQNDHMVTAMEKSPGACEVMRLNGIDNVLEKDIFQYHDGQFQTALMMMNGLGLAGTLGNLSNLLLSVFKNLAPNGQIIADSSDISYLYDHQSFPESRYYGELEYTYEYQGKRAPTFPWLFIDIDRLQHESSKVGLLTQLIFEEEEQYLVRIHRSEI